MRRGGGEFFMDITFENWRGILYVHNGKYNIRCIIVDAIKHPQLDLVDLALPVVELLHEYNIPSEHVDLGVLLPGHDLEELADVRGFLVRRQALDIKDLPNLVNILGLNIQILVSFRFFLFFNILSIFLEKRFGRNV